MRDEEQSHVTSSGEQLKQTRAERAVGKQMTALDLLARWSGHHYFIGCWYTLFPVEIQRPCRQLCWVGICIGYNTYTGLYFMVFLAGISR